MTVRAHGEVEDEARVGIGGVDNVDLRPLDNDYNKHRVRLDDQVGQVSSEMSQLLDNIGGKATEVGMRISADGAAGERDINVKEAVKSMADAKKAKTTEGRKDREEKKLVQDAVSAMFAKDAKAGEEAMESWRQAHDQKTQAGEEFLDSRSDATESMVNALQDHERIQENMNEQVKEMKDVQAYASQIQKKLDKLSYLGGGMPHPVVPPYAPDLLETDIQRLVGMEYGLDINVNGDDKNSGSHKSLVETHVKTSSNSTEQQEDVKNSDSVVQKKNH